MEIPIIEPSQDDIKEKPDEIELFPYSDSSIWSAFKKDNEIKDVESDLDSTQTNITKDNHKDSINNKTVSESIKTDDTFDGIPEPDKSDTSNAEKEDNNPEKSSKNQILKRIK